MKKNLLFVSLCLGLGFAQLTQAQTKGSKRVNTNKNVFDEQAAIDQANAKGIKASDIAGYVQFLKNDFSSQKALDKQVHKHTPYEGGATGDIQETVIYIEPNKPMSIGCPNMSFDLYNFTGWTGETGTVATGGTSPVFTATGASIINSAGNNVSILNTTNYHTIMTQLPGASSLWPNVVGWDSSATKLIGGQNISQIPLVSPFSFDPVSVRMNGAVSNSRGCRLKYITTTSSTNKQITFSYAVCLQNPAGHVAGESPYFKVEVKNEGTGAVLPGCTSYTFNPKSTSPADSLFQSSTGSAFDPTFYRKWQFYSVDLSSLPSGTSVSINFEVGGCSLGGHWGYAYVDAECGGLGVPYVSMCVGDAYATLVAPTGFTSYQWSAPGTGTITGATNDTLLVNGPISGTPVYTVTMVSPGGCVVSSTVTIVPTTVSIINLNSTTSCAGGSSGMAFVQAIGGSSYSYVWTDAATGAVVSTSQTATGLPPGSYNITVSSPSCGSASANVTVGVSPPFFYSQSKPFCGNSTFIARPGGSNYLWYAGSTPTVIPAPEGTNDTLYIANAVAGDVYSVVYDNATGCRDSIAYTLTQIPGGNTFVSNIKNVCPGDADGAALLNLNTSFPSPYIYTVTDSGNNLIANMTTAASTLALTPLSQGSYTAIITDGVCIYINTFTISPIQTNFTITPTNTVLCFPTDTAMLNLNFGAAAPTMCGLDPSICSGGPTQLFSAGPFTQNGTTSYPTPYGNFYTYGRTQFLVQKADLNAAGIFAGKISSLAFNVLNMNSSISNYPNFFIKMGCTSLANLPTASFSSTQPFITGLQTVYSNPSQPVALGWVTHNFTQSYLWDGVSNIIIEVCFGMNTPSTWIQNVSIELKQRSYTSVMYHVEDSSPVCAGTQPADNGNGGLMVSGANMLPNMRLGYCSYAAPASSYTVSLVGSNGTVFHNYGNDSLKVVPTFTAAPTPNANTVYTLSVINPDGGCVASQTVAILYPSAHTIITAIPTTTTICEGSNADLSAVGAVIYNWFYHQGTSNIPIANTQSVNVTPPSIGVNTYIVTGSSPCPGNTPDTKTITVTVNPKANLIITPLQDVTKCLNKDYVITTGVGSTTPGNTGAPYTYQWTTLPGNVPAPGSNTFSNYVANSNSTTTLVVTVNGACAKEVKDTIVIKNFIDDLTASIIDSSSACANSPFVLNSNASGGYLNYNYAWYILPGTNSISSSSSLSSISPSSSGVYTVALTVTDSCGYNETSYRLITVLPPCTVVIPNVITPNGDGTNEFFKISGIEFHPNTAVTIFDRWGTKVFESPNYNNDWKADGVSDGTFFYVVDVPDDKKYSGFISVFHSK